MSPWAIEFDHISKSYTPEEVVLTDINLSIKAGELVVLLGHSGCGKTTLLKLVNKLLDFDSGYLRIHGKKISDWDIEQLRRSIGWAIQHGALFPHMRIWENISYVLRLQGVEKNRRRERAAELLQVVGLPAEYLDRYPRSLSGGQRQRVGVARALAANPSIILMDEPFGAVDEQTRLQLQQELLQIHARFGQTILFVTHDIHEAFRLGDRIVLIDEGKILQAGSKEELVFEPASERVSSFLGTKGFSALLDDELLCDLHAQVQSGSFDPDLCLQRLAAIKGPALKAGPSASDRSP